MSGKWTPHFEEDIRPEGCRYVSEGLDLRFNNANYNESIYDDVMPLVYNMRKEYQSLMNLTRE